MPEIRPFRALRFDPAAVADLRGVVAPPYDVLGSADVVGLLERHPANVVRLDLPIEEQGDEPDDRYRRAARTLAGWRSGGLLRKDPHPSVYVYEQTYRVPGTTEQRRQIGFFGRLRLEPFGPGSGVLPHERTLAGPKEDRYKLLRATGVNTSPIVVLVDGHDDVTAFLERATSGSPDVDFEDGDGVRHRLWPIAADGDDAAEVGAMLTAAGGSPVAIADGHHRYETALRYRDERRMSRSCEEDPPFDYVLTLFVPIAGQELTVLPTHRLIHGVSATMLATLHERAGELFDIRTGLDADTLRSTFDQSGLAEGGHGRFGLWTADGGSLLSARPEAFGAPVPGGGPAYGRLDVVLLGVALERLLGIGADAVTAGAITYTKSASDAIDAVDRGDASAAFLLDPTPISSIVAVARDGDVMPQKSTYFYPKALTGLVINPHEW